MKKLRTDVLIIGGGAAGARAAYEAKRHDPALDVTLLHPGGRGGRGNTALVASESLGINAPFDLAGDGDSPEVYLRDMLDTGLGLADAGLCRIIADEAATRVRELIDLGVAFDGAPAPTQRRLSGCTKARSLAVGGATGRALLGALHRACRRAGVRMLPTTRVVDLISPPGRVAGAYAIQEGRPLVIDARATVLSTGGAGRLFRRHVNSAHTNGEGWGMALRAGARLTNIEFFQIGPGVVWPRTHFILHSSFWRLRPQLRNSLGEAFLQRYCPSDLTVGELLDLKAMSYPFSTRTPAMYVDIAIFSEIVAGRASTHRGVYLDLAMRDAAALERTAPHTCAALRRAGADLTKDPVEIAPVVQNFNGGVAIDADGFTGVPGLWAAGEVTGGVHGADRPGGNNLADTQVFGYRAGVAAAAFAAVADRHPSSGQTAFPVPGPSPAETRRLAEVAGAMDRHLNVVRTEAGLVELLAEIETARADIGDQISTPTYHRLLAAEALVVSALKRRESRGTHYRADHPRTDAAYDRPFLVALEETTGALSCIAAEPQSSTHRPSNLGGTHVR